MPRHLVFIALLILCASACKSPQVLIDREKLKADSDWLIVRAMAQKEIERKEGSSGWGFTLSEKESAALYPTYKDDSIWTVIACADYPENTLGKIVEMKISKRVGVLFYFQRWKGKAGRSSPAEESSLSPSK